MNYEWPILGGFGARLHAKAHRTHFKIVNHSRGSLSEPPLTFLNPEREAIGSLKVFSQFSENWSEFSFQHGWASIDRAPDRCIPLDEFRWVAIVQESSELSELRRETSLGSCLRDDYTTDHTRWSHYRVYIQAVFRFSTMNCFCFSIVPIASGVLRMGRFRPHRLGLTASDELLLMDLPIRRLFKQTIWWLTKTLLFCSFLNASL